MGDIADSNHNHVPLPTQAYYLLVLKKNHFVISVVWLHLHTVQLPSKYVFTQTNALLREASLHSEQ